VIASVRPETPDNFTSMIVEFLTFDVDADIRAEWLEADARTWTRYLESRPGFISKQLWVQHGTPDQVHAIIMWSNVESWLRTPQEEIAALDSQMGELFRQCTVRAYDVIGGGAGVVGGS
jgi:uncharacterized protein (TIGR03792 family)